MPSAIKKEVKHYSWFELMQMYDKLGDCIHLFNNIYCGQVFIMYNSWLLCTMLLICRSLSPSIKKWSSDFTLFVRTPKRKHKNIQYPFFNISESLQHVLLFPDAAYVSQVQTMIMLVTSRKLEISANVFTVNVPTVMNFAGRIISYTVLMIQYFYNRVFMQ
ncbi:uncharacterized protein LOC113496750 [Trichoplusia ni]|uniref:Uncharacterized protein LOC113496750 n=1 Tax=Trichoplusia ni TaxID=7111 RepID=A0A7E5VU55_TRINI|nr:uncharacterized protein LOC113496750 [Trichoplusia ni]